MNDSAAPLVTVTDVHLSYGAGDDVVHALRGVTLDLRPGELIGLLGPSGSGKSTLFHVIVGWEQPDTGSVERRADVSADWRGLAVVPQGIGLLDELTLAENVELAAMLGSPQRHPTDELLDVLGLAGLGRRAAFELSLGEQQRGAIARALASRPLVLVADEPTAHQDEVNAGRVVTLLRAAADAGCAVLVATHDERILDDFDRIVHLADGRLDDPG